MPPPFFWQPKDLPKTNRRVKRKLARTIKEFGGRNAGRFTGTEKERQALGTGTEEAGEWGMINNLPKAKLKNFVKKIGSGITPKGGAATYTSKGIQFIRSQNVLQNRLDLTDVAFIDEGQHRRMSGSLVKQNDVLLNITGASIGRSCTVPPVVQEANVSQHVCIIRLKDEINPIFLSIYLNSWFGQKQIWSFQGGGSREGLNYQQIGGFDIPMMPRKEQDAIADLLSIWNQYIEETEHLIAAKEKKILSLSNRYLFGGNHPATAVAKRTRWFSVPDHWKIVRIGSVAKEVKSINASEEKIPVLSCTKYDGLVDSLTYFDKQIFSVDRSNYKVVSRGQFSYATNHIEEGSIGYQDLCEKGLVSPMYTVFQTNNSIDDLYLYQVLKTNIYLHIFRVNTSASVDRRGSLRWKEFAKLPIPLPPMNEQKKISTLLNTAQQEIDVLKKQLEAYRQQKRGLMQKLLTGQWRAKIKEGNA